MANCQWCGEKLDKASYKGREKKFCSVACKNTKNVTDWRKRTKLRAVEYLGGKCQRCGYNKCVGALIFHHKDTTKKEFSISHSGRIRAWDRIKKEIDKCDLLCANCHAETHDIPGQLDGRAAGC